jgi:hypothetical protein
MFLMLMIIMITLIQQELEGFIDQYRTLVTMILSLPITIGTVMIHFYMVQVFIMATIFGIQDHGIQAGT